MEHLLGRSVANPRRCHVYMFSLAKSENTRPTGRESVRHSEYSTDQKRFNCLETTLFPLAVLVHMLRKVMQLLGRQLDSQLCP